MKSRKLPDVLTDEQSDVVQRNMGLIRWYLNRFGKKYVKFFGWEECFSLCSLALCCAVRDHASSKGSLSTLAAKCFYNKLETEFLKQTVCNDRGESRRSLSFDGELDTVLHGWSFVDQVDLDDAIGSLPEVQQGYLRRFLANGGSIRQAGLEVGVTSSSACQAFHRSLEILRESYV